MPVHNDRLILELLCFHATTVTESQTHHRFTFTTFGYIHMYALVFPFLKPYFGIEAV